MKKLVCSMIKFLKYILILWVPILLIEETFLLNYVNVGGSLICSWAMSVLCLIIYIKTYKKENQEKINCYKYNLVNTTLLVITNLILGYLFLYFIDSNIFHQCAGEGWDCFLFGIEYIIIGMEYAFFSIVIFIIWLIVRLIKYLSNKTK